MLKRGLDIIVMLSVAAACGSSTEPSGTPDLIASKVAVLAIGVATGGEGHAFFDNFITCPRRGVINYINSPNGRLATFTGCDAGDGVVVDGDAEVRWVEGGDRSRIARVDVGGTLRVRTPNGTESSVTQLTASGISFTSPTEPAVLNLVTAPVRVTWDGTSAPLDQRASPANVFAPPGRSVDAIPNPTSSLDALSDVDLKAIAYGTGMRLANLLFDETIESQRGEHEHQLSCGRIHVIPDATTQLVRLENTWTSCDLGEGVFVSGTFVQRWTAFDNRSGVISMVVEGSPVLGGNVPRVALTRLEWTLSALSSPGAIRISGKLIAGSTERAFSFDLVADD